MLRFQLAQRSTSTLLLCLEVVHRGSKLVLEGGGRLLLLHVLSVLLCVLCLQLKQRGVQACLLSLQGLHCGLVLIPTV